MDASSVERVTSQGTNHLERQHSDELEAVFEDKYDWTCQGDCDHKFSNEDTGFDCPRCGYDNFSDFADRYVWWQIQID